ncbi:uncharacterized protein LOC119316163 [Triticum dicoccoides]|uniref:uncharacterized protein LOC119316163 n=1 Tax=Triticum dicoccoides TaxID=85692 RepID=UPI0018911DEE|nr:uncharacterized protein LOC119316163 [Triticum dicoccoides]
MTQENHLAMKSSGHLFNEWEIRLLVLLSFTMQLFLFFVGGLRRRITNSALRFSIWLAYVGADMVAVYVLGLISRVHLDATTENHHHLAFLWAPFLLIHLGGQDTVTAFAIEDISLWLRHLLNLVVQVSLTLYIFWKSTNGLNIQELLLPTILLFVSGMIKYGERTWALCCGSLINIAEFPIPQYLTDLDKIHVGSTSSSYSGLVSKALFSIKEVRWIFSSYSPLGTDLSMNSDLLLPDYAAKLFETMEIELGLMFDDIYTKAQVLRTWGGIILRCLSDISFLAAFVLFSVRNKERHNTVDTAITYVLFIGGFSLEVFAVFTAMVSPWIWAWLKTRHCSFLSSISISWQRKRVLWSKSMGQYSLLNYLGQCDQQSSKVMAVVRRLVNAVCGRKQKLWVSKLLDTKFVGVDEKVMRCIVERIKQYQSTDESSMLPQWPNLAPLLQRSLRVPEADFHFPILVLHIYTEVMLSRYAPTATVDGGLDRVCRTISNYMVYLCATHHEMLSVQNSSNQSDLAYILHRLFSVGTNTDITNIMPKAVGFLIDCRFPVPPKVCTEAHLLEIRDAWVGFLLHAASKSRPEMHAAQLARGGEFLTFVWLLMAHCNLGNSRGCPIGLLPISGDVQWRCVFHIRPPPQSS